MAQAQQAKPVSTPIETGRAVVILLFVLVGVWYLNWRLSSFNPEAWIFSIVVYGAEVYGFMAALMHFYMNWRLTDRQAPAAAKGATVDVFIPTYNESMELVRRTLKAALNLDYPAKVWLLDDGNRAEMRQLAAELGCQYLAREDNRDAKAGNLNHALKHSDGEFIAIFDADHAPRRNFLSRTLGYFRDARVAFVQTPQDFYNLDSFQHRGKAGKGSIWTEQSLFFRVIQRGKDQHNAAFFCGSCAIIRRQALEAIGGIATGTITEDLHTSIRLHKQGYQSVYHAESLAYGLAPAQVEPFLKQRIRWGQGAMQVWKKEGVLFARGLSLAQRINYFASMTTYFDGWQKGIFYLAPIIVLTTGLMPLASPGWDFLLHFIPFYLLNFWAFEEISRGYGRTLYIEQYNMSRFAVFAWATLGLFRKRLSFKVTAKGLRKEGRFDFLSLPQKLVFLGSLLAILLGGVLFVATAYLPWHAVVANALWAALNAGLAYAILSFSRGRDKNQRGEYRFKLPLVARLQFAGQDSLLGTVDDISPKGLRFYGRTPEHLPAGTHFTGMLFLPGGPLRISGTTTAQADTAADAANRAISCRLESTPNEATTRIEQFLFGSDLELRLNGLEERQPTPLERLGLINRQARDKTLGDDLAGGHWNAVQLTLVNGRAQQQTLAVTRLDASQQPTRVLSQVPLSMQDCYWMTVHARMARAIYRGRFQEETRLDSPLGPLFLYAFQAQAFTRHEPMADDQPLPQLRRA